MATTDQRAHMKALMKWLADHNPQINWQEIRPMGSRGYLEQTLADHFAAKGSITMDCSESCTLICRMAGLADPNGFGYNGYGFTGSMLAHLPHYTNPKDAATGALCVYGPGTGSHVTMVYEPDAHDPLMFSHGQNADPRLLKMSVVKANEPAGVRFLSIAKL